MALSDITGNLVKEGISNFLSHALDDAIKSFSLNLTDLMDLSINVLNMPLVQNGIAYTQKLAFALLVIKGMYEIINTYMLYQDGDPDADVEGTVFRIARAAILIAIIPKLVELVYTFGGKVAEDVANISAGTSAIIDWVAIITGIITSRGVTIIFAALVAIIMIIIVFIQASIRGAEIARTMVVGAALALNLTNTNNALWSTWLRQLIALCLTQALQIFMIKGALSMLSSRVISGSGILLVIGWLWATIKVPAWLNQLTYSTGFFGALGGTARQAGSMALMRRMIRR